MPRAEGVNKESVRFCFEGSDELVARRSLSNKKKLFE